MTPSAANNTPAGSVTVLYIEDDTANRQLVQLILERRKEIHFVEAENGHDGLDIAKKCHPDIILLDLGLPDLSGFEVLKRLRQKKEFADVPVIAVSGDNLPEDIEIGLQAGFDGYLSKPINIAKLDQALDRSISSLS